MLLNDFLIAVRTIKVAKFKVNPSWTDRRVANCCWLSKHTILFNLPSFRQSRFISALAPFSSFEKKSATVVFNTNSVVNTVVWAFFLYKVRRSVISLRLFVYLHKRDLSKICSSWANVHRFELKRPIKYGSVPIDPCDLSLSLSNLMVVFDFCWLPISTISHRSPQVDERLWNLSRPLSDDRYKVYLVR